MTGVIPDGFAGLRELKRVLLNDNRYSYIVYTIYYYIYLPEIEIVLNYQMTTNRNRLELSDIDKSKLSDVNKSKSF